MYISYVFLRKHKQKQRPKQNDSKNQDADINQDNTIRLNKHFRNKSRLKSFAFYQITVSELVLLKNEFKINILLPKFIWVLAISFF